MNLKEFTDKNGDTAFVDPADVLGIERTDSIRPMSIIRRRSTTEPLVVRGHPREVAAALATPEDTLKRSAVMEDALALEYRLALGTSDDNDDGRTWTHGRRYEIRALANRLGIVLDEHLINTPLPEGE